MSKHLNTIPIQQFLQQVKAADLSQQKEIKLDIKTAKALAYCLSDITARLAEDYDSLLQKLLQSTGQTVTVQMDGGKL